MLLVADQNDPVPLCGEFAQLTMDVFDEWAGRMNDEWQLCLPCLAPDVRGVSMSAETQFSTGRNIIDGLHDLDAAPVEIGYDVLVMDDLVKHIKRSAVALEGPLDALNCHFD